MYIHINIQTIYINRIEFENNFKLKYLEYNTIF